MDNNIIPEVINGYNVYDNEAKRLIGVSGEIPLPDFETLTATMSGAGLLGEIDDPVIGQFKPSEIEIPFRSLYSSMFDLMDTGSPLSLTIRGSEQGTNKTTSRAVEKQIRVVVKGKFKGISGGKMKIGEGVECKVKMEVWYTLYEVGGEKKLELDKFNGVYNVNGKDMLAEVNKFC